MTHYGSILIFWLATSMAAQTGTIRGRVVDARGGEASAHVSVRLGEGTQRTVTDDAGKFEFANAPGDGTTLTATTVGYHAVSISVVLEAGEPKQFEVVLSADNFHRSDTVTFS